MQIQKSGRANDLFMEELAKRLPKKAEVEHLPEMEKQLEEDRKDKGQEAEADNITETQLEHKDEPKTETFEGQLEKSRKASRAATPNIKGEGVTEQRLNEASKDAFPHRNDKAWKRTDEKRPVNALREEMGNASDEAKRERYEKANTSGPKRSVDKDVGSQLTNKTAQMNKTLPLPEVATPGTQIQPAGTPLGNKPQQAQSPQDQEAWNSLTDQQRDYSRQNPEWDWLSEAKKVGGALLDGAQEMLGWMGKAKGASFNLKRQKLAKKVEIRKSCSDYIAYKSETAGNVKTAGLDKFAEVKELDSIMTGIMQAALDDGRELTHDDLAKIAALKDRKSALLING